MKESVIIIIIQSESNSLFIAHASIQDWDKNSVELAKGQLGARIPGIDDTCMAIIIF